MSYTGLPNIIEYDYLIYKDSYDANKIKARNGKTAKVDFNHSTDFGNVFNSCVNALPSTGGIIHITSGTFETNTTCIFRDYLTVKGAGINVTIIKLADGANKDVMATDNFDTMIANRPTDGYFTETGVIHDVTLENLSIDGNKDNNATGRYGLAKIAYAWNITNLMVYNCKSDGIYTEWGTINQCPGFPSHTARCMEDYWVTVSIHHCDGQGLTFRGPHDTMITNLMSWGNVGMAATWEASGTIYVGGCQVTNFHCFSAINPGTVMIKINTHVIGHNWQIEGGSGADTGVGLEIDGTARVDLTGSRVFSNYTGIKINSGSATIGHSLIDGCHIFNNTVGLACYGVQNKVSAYFRQNTTDIILGDATLGAAGYNDIRAKCTRSGTALVWGSSSNIQNYIDLSVIALAGDKIIDEVGVPNMANNHISIWGLDTSLGYPTGKAMRYVPRVTMMPSHKKWGTWSGVSTATGDGIFGFTHATVGTASAPASAADGRFLRYTSGAVTNNSAGIRFNAPITIRDWNARMRVKFRMQNTDARLYLGWRGSSSTDPTSDDPSNASPGFYFGKTAAATSWEILRNDASGATVVSNVSGDPEPDTNIHEVDFWTTSAGYGCRLDGGVDNFFTTEVPTSSHFMAIVFQTETTTDATRYIDLWYAEIVQDK